MRDGSIYALILDVFVKYNVIQEEGILVAKQQAKYSSVLQEYYARYLNDVRGVSKSTVHHYWDALKYISCWLKERNLVKKDIYEIDTVEQLEQMREILYADRNFIALNKRGNQMYSAGLNNYLRFANGEGFHEIKDRISFLDIPMVAGTYHTEESKKWKRSTILRNQAIEYAGYSCEMNHNHNSFIAARTNKMYMEAHHVLPLHLQKHFLHSLDVYANLICLCPICHRRIHYGLFEERKEMIDKIYEERIDRLAKSGLRLGKNEFEDMGLEILRG